MYLLTQNVKVKLWRPEGPGVCQMVTKEGHMHTAGASWEAEHRETIHSAPSPLCKKLKAKAYSILWDLKQPWAYVTDGNSRYPDHLS